MNLISDIIGWVSVQKYVDPFMGKPKFLAWEQQMIFVISLSEKVYSCFMYMQNLNIATSL